MSMNNTLIPALCSVTFRSLSPEALVSLAADNGVKAIEWGADVHVPPGDTEQARQVSTLCREQGIDAASYGSYVRAGDPGAMGQFRQALDTAQALGANNIRVWAGRNTHQNYRESERQQIALELSCMADEAARQDIAVSVEFHRNTLTERVQDAVALLQQADNQNLFSYWQPVPGRSLEERLIEIATLAPWLGHLHVFHWISDNARDERRPLAEGLELWQPVMSAWTTSSHWTQPQLAMLEFVANDEIEQFQQDMQALRQLCTAC